VNWLALFLTASVLSPPGPHNAFLPEPGVLAAPVSPGGGGGAAALVIDAMPYARTVTCSDYTLTGTASGGSGAVSWSASPSGASGACTGTTSWSCVVDVAPDAVGEGVEVITVARSGAASDTETIGFYVDGEHSCFLSQSVDGSYNSTVANNDAVGTWQNLGSSALDVTQGTGSAQPTFRTSIVGGQPVVRCDGGDRIAATTASDWTFLYQGADFTVEHVGATTSGNGTYLTTAAVNGGHGYASLSVVSSVYMQIVNATPATNLDFSKSSYTAGQFHLTSQILDDDGGAGNDGSIYLDSLAVATAARASTFSVTTAAALNVCAYAAAGLPLTGDLFRAIIYQSALTSTQRGINKAVDEWALGGALPVTP
jgi:hypothetical protein